MAFTSTVTLYLPHTAPSTALYNYFDKIFSEHKSSTGLDHKDTWTLHFLSRGYCKYVPSIYAETSSSSSSVRPAIGDGIDEDSSGFISLPEVGASYPASRSL